MLRERQSIPSPVLQPLFKSTATFAGYNLFFGLIHPQIDNAAQLGGLLAGVALGWLIALPVENETRQRRWPARLGLGLGVFAGLMAGGVTFSPRYDYRVRDELHLSAVNKAPTAAESRLLQEQETLAKSAQTGGNPAARQAWIEETAPSFYADWRGGLAALSLAPDKVTHANRRLMVRYLDAKLADYRALSTGLRHSDPMALTAYYAEEQCALEEFRARVGAKKITDPSAWTANRPPRAAPIPILRPGAAPRQGPGSLQSLSARA